MEWDLTAHKAGGFRKGQRTFNQEGAERMGERVKIWLVGARVRAEVKGKARAAGESG